MSTANNSDEARQPQAPARPADVRPQSHPAARLPDWDAVDEASWESFPASDPPSRWAGPDRQPTPAPTAQASQPGERTAGGAQSDAGAPARRHNLRSLLRWAAGPAVHAVQVSLWGSLRVWAGRWRSRHSAH